MAYTMCGVTNPYSPHSHTCVLDRNDGHQFHSDGHMTWAVSGGPENGQDRRGALAELSSHDQEIGLTA